MHVFDLELMLLTINVIDGIAKTRVTKGNTKGEGKGEGGGGGEGRGGGLLL